MRAPERSSQRHFELLQFPNAKEARPLDDTGRRQPPWWRRVLIFNMFTLAILAWLAFGLLAWATVSTLRSVSRVLGAHGVAVPAVETLDRHVDHAPTGGDR